MTIKSLTIYCSSSNYLSKDYYTIADQIGAYLGGKSIKIIYGGGKTGIMGRVANSSIKNNGKVIGIIPKNLISKEIINYSITKTIIVSNMNI